jgi:hypothetical protein
MAKKKIPLIREKVLWALSLFLPGYDVKWMVVFFSVSNLYL